MSLFPKEDILTKEEIESWRSFVDSLSSSEDRELFETLLNDCYNYPAAINAESTFSSRTIDYGIALLYKIK